MFYRAIVDCVKNSVSPFTWGPRGKEVSDTTNEYSARLFESIWFFQAFWIKCRFKAIREDFLEPFSHFSSITVPAAMVTSRYGIPRIVTPLNLSFIDDFTLGVGALKGHAKLSGRRE